MDHRYQPGPLPPPGEPTRTPPAPDGAISPEETARNSCEQLTAEKIIAVRHAFYTAAAQAIFTLQNGQRLTGEQSFAAAHAQASRTWWDLVDEEVTGKRLTCDHALRRVRSWARHYLTGEPPAARPGTLFDHALAHAARIAARDFLTDSGHLLTQHLIHQAANPAANPAGTPALATPAPHDHPQPVSPAPPASTVAGP